MDDATDTALQRLCRKYLQALKPIAVKHKLGGWVEEILSANENKTCHATEEEVELLARCVDEERLKRTDVPKLLGKSYRECNDDDDFDKIKKLPHVGIYSRVNTLLYKIKNNGNKQKKV